MQGWKGGQCTWSTMSSTAKMLGPRLFYDFKKCYSVSAVFLPRIAYFARCDLSIISAARLFIRLWHSEADRPRTDLYFHQGSATCATSFTQKMLSL